MKVHKSVTMDRITEMARESMFGTEDNGICISCGADAYGVEPDAENYTCKSCGEEAVFGGEQLLFLTIA
jgi:predicted RNA-binding Zn-ribbon protein involved in translation (DUF1610 family)